jgi:hypothetical protein
MPTCWPSSSPRSAMGQWCWSATQWAG